MRDHADGHAAGGVDGTAVLPAAAGVFLGALGTVRGGKFGFRELKVFGFTNGIVELEVHGLLRGETHGERTLGTIGTRIDQRVELEFDADFFLRESFHFVNFMDIDGGWDSL